MERSFWSSWKHADETCPKGNVLVGSFDELLDNSAVDMSFAEFFGVSDIPQDDHANAWEFCAVIETQERELFVVCSAVHNLSIDDDESYYHWAAVSQPVADKIRDWYEKRRNAEEAERAHKARCLKVIREHGLDDQTIALRREEILRKAGLL